MSLAIARRFAAVWSAKRPGRTPGESSKSRSPPTRTQRKSLVTPGLGADAHVLLFVRRFMSALLPTLG